MFEEYRHSQETMQSPYVEVDCTLPVVDAFGGVCDFSRDRLEGNANDKVSASGLCVDNSNKQVE